MDERRCAVGRFLLSARAFSAGVVKAAPACTGDKFCARAMEVGMSMTNTALLAFLYRIAESGMVLFHFGG